MVCRVLSVAMNSMPFSICVWTFRRSILILVSDTAFFSLSAYSSTRWVFSPRNRADEWHCSHVSEADGSWLGSGTIGVEYDRRINARTRRVPAAFAETNDIAPGPAVAVDALHVGVRAGLVRDELGLHDRVAHLAAERHAVHVLDAAIRRHRDNRDVGDRQHRDD